ncbi:Rrf2 family transcriptional regulator [Rhizobium sp. SAFR-030]|uniref:Rrf2 family transcriptional regulator n=1 Tax=Rhizobium sp. SAFR-030 TaxID=3387277 RepID=UPI003F7D6C94
MRQDSRLSRMLHVLIHMAEAEKPLTSDAIAMMLNTNPVVVRRTMGGLRDAGYVHSEKGHGGGWTLARPLADISLLDVYRAVGEPDVFAIGSAYDRPECLVEQAVTAAVDDALRDAEALLLRRFKEVSLADLAADFGRRLQGHRPCGTAD